MKNKAMNVILHHFKDDNKPTWVNKKILHESIFSDVNSTL
jgi:hypothetical protein